MLVKPQITAFIATINQAEAKDFYENTLGLRLVSEDNYALEFDALGVSLRITSVEKFSPQPFAVLGFKIDEITSQVRILVEKGVQFERYESLEQDELNIWKSPSEARVAWFTDPDGNLLSLTEYPE